MAQAGYTPILIYASGTATNIPTAGNLISGSSGAELAINYADGKLYYKDGSGNVKLLSIGYGSSSVTPTNGGVQYGTGTALALTAAGSSGQILRSNGAAAPTWADLSTLGVNTISFGTTGLTPNSATAGAVTVAGTLVTANGGTGLGGATPFTANGVLYASSASALTSGSALTFDGSTLNATTASNVPFLGQSSSGSNTSYIYLKNAASSSTYTVAFGSTGDSALFVAGAAEGMRLTSTGLGIGTSSPAYKLHTYGSNSVGALIQTTGTLATISFQGSGSSTNYSVRCGTDGQDFVTYTANTERMRLDSSGNLGLGVTPSAWGASYRAEDVGGACAITSSTTGDVWYNCYNNGTNNLYKNSGYKASIFRQNNGAFEWHNTNTAGPSAGALASLTQAMTLDASGRLGIGPTSPTTLLDLSQSSSGGSTGTYPTVRVANTNTTTQSLADFQAIAENGTITGQFAAIFSGGERYVRVAALTNHYLQFMTNSTERARITSGGDLLVGTTSAIASGKQSIAFSGAVSAGLSIKETAAGAGTFVNFVNSSGSTIGQINQNGASNVSYNTSSDYRLKNTITPMTGALAKVALLKPCTYKWNVDGSDGEGFIAHELAEVCPQAVSGEKDAVDAEGNPQYQGIDTSFLVATLTAAIQEQQALITSLTARVALLEGN